MKYSIVAIAVVALSTGAVAQEPASTWQFFENEGGRTGANVRNADGSQLVLKCDKSGRREVHAIVLAGSEKLGFPNTRPVSRPITFQFDDTAPKVENWGFFETYVIAQGKTSDRALARFVTRLRDAKQVRMRLDRETGSPVDLTFDVTGAAEAITRVYETCKDSVPS